MKIVGHFDCLTKKNSHLKFLEISLTFVGVGDVSFHYKLFSL